MVRFSAFVLALLFWLVPNVVFGLDIVLVGDSHMEGVAPYLSPALTAQGHNVHVVARRGWSCGSYRRAGSYLRRRARGADLVVVLLGANDRVRDDEEYREDLDWVLAQLGSAQVVWFGPPVALDPELDAWHFAATEAQPRLLPNSVEWVDSRIDTADLTHAPDSMHFLFSSYSEWASRIMIRLQPHL